MYSPEINGGADMHARTTGLSVVILMAFLTGAACHAVGELTGQASDEWVRSYPLTAGGELQITNTNGAIDVEGIDGTTVEVRAERTARGLSDDSARELLPRISIGEEIAPNKVAIRTEGISGILVGASFQVRYRVRAPRSAVVRLRTTNGGLTLKALDGGVVASTTNGNIVGEELGGRVEARTTNGSARFALTGVTVDGVNVRTTNGNVQLTMPESINANLTATCRNGTIEITGIEFKPDGEQTRRRAQGKLNGGGAPIEVSTVNGGVRISAREGEL
jgi:putative adhesin